MRSKKPEEASSAFPRRDSARSVPMPSKTLRIGAHTAQDQRRNEVQRANESARELPRRPNNRPADIHGRRGGRSGSYPGGKSPRRDQHDRGERPIPGTYTYTYTYASAESFRRISSGAIDDLDLRRACAEATIHRLDRARSREIAS
ncbi:hypothetical protein HN011_010137 [Eciton burchellii]|nr:hypothetical protein HN011_010137 [Eciton burchellii]